jgi:hypothetical protein
MRNVEISKISTALADNYNVCRQVWKGKIAYTPSAQNTKAEALYPFFGPEPNELITNVLIDRVI